MAGDADPPRPANHPPGYDEEDPYEGADVTDFPAWWRRNVEEFRRHRMRPYRPPRFADGAVTTAVIEDVEVEHDVDVRVRSVNPHEEGDWKVWVDGEPVAAIGRTRTPEGTARYAVTAGEFRRLVRDAVEE